MSTRNILNALVLETAGQDLHHIIDTVAVDATGNIAQGTILLADGTVAAAGALADNTAKYAVYADIDAATVVGGQAAVRAVKLGGAVTLAGAVLNLDGTALSGAELVELAQNFAVSVA